MKTDGWMDGAAHGAHGQTVKRTAFYITVKILFKKKKSDKPSTAFVSVRDLMFFFRLEKIQDHVMDQQSALKVLWMQVTLQPVRMTDRCWWVEEGEANNTRLIVSPVRVLRVPGRRVSACRRILLIPVFPFRIFVFIKC